MYGLIARYVATFALGLLLGWTVQGWRKGQEIATIRQEHSDKSAEAQTQARAKEQELSDSADKVRKDKDAKIDTIRRQLDTALVGLRNRKERPAVIREVPGAPAACDGARGSELYREDAEFLTREAARADETAAKLNACIQQYNELRN